MEYLREEKKEKERKKGKKGKKKRKKEKGKKKDIGSATSRIGIIVVEESSDKTETSTQDVEVGQSIETFTEQERKASWVDRIKTIGKYSILCFYFST